MQLMLILIIVPYNIDMKHSTLVRLSAYGLRTGLFLIAVTVCAGLVFGSPSTLKSALQASGAYQKASVALVEQAGNALRTLDNQPAVDTAAQASFTPAAVQTATESAVDSSYDWLEGTTDSPNISIDFRPYINGFTQNLGEQATQRASPSS